MELKTSFIETSSYCTLSEKDLVVTYISRPHALICSRERELTVFNLRNQQNFPTTSVCTAHYD